MTVATLVSIVVVLVVVGVLLWGLQQLPMDNTLRTIIRVLVIVCAVLFVVAQFAGALPGGRLW
jgi:hypothetical protein